MITVNSRGKKNYNLLLVGLLFFASTLNAHSVNDNAIMSDNFPKILSEYNFFNTAAPPKIKPEISAIRSLIESNDVGVARHALEDWIQNNLDDSESIAVLLETIDPNEEPYLHSYYSSILLSLDKGSTIHLANLFSNSYSQLKSYNSYSITGLTT